MNRSLFLAPTLLAVCLGCATIGTDFDSTKTAQLVLNVSTKDEAVKLLGQPRTTSQTSGGVTVYVWSYAHAVVFAGAKSKVIYLTFNKDGILTHMTSSGTNL